MQEDLDSAARYRKRAGELRAIAKTMDDVPSKRALLDIAEDYEWLARVLRTHSRSRCWETSTEALRAQQRGERGVRNAIRLRQMGHGHVVGSSPRSSV